MNAAQRNSARDVMRFVGVSTEQSSIMRVFPRWSEMLGLNADLVGLDLPLEAPPERYREAMVELRDDPRCRGALVTTHKIAVYDAARDLFSGFDEFARACGEVSSVTVADGTLLGSAKDPLTVALSMEEFLAPTHFSGEAQVLCLGAGGAGTAIAWYLAHREDRPHHMHFIDQDQQRADRLARVLANTDSTGLQTSLLADVDVARAIAALPPNSVVINATGLGKDRPGSPLPDGTVLPERAVVWELNYRGQLDFLHQAREQQNQRELSVIDGWRYFVHGWTQVIGEVFAVPMTSELVDELATAAEVVR